MFLFNLICTWGKLSVFDEQHFKMTKVNEVFDNQVQIVKKLKTIMAEETEVDFKTLKKKHLKDWNKNRTQVMQDTGMRITALMQGKDPEVFIQEIKDRNANIQKKAV